VASFVHAEPHSLFQRLFPSSAFWFSEVITERKDPPHCLLTDILNMKNEGSNLNIAVSIDGIDVLKEKSKEKPTSEHWKNLFSHKYHQGERKEYGAAVDTSELKLKFKVENN